MMRLRRAEQELVALDILIEGRNARNGYCTWLMIQDGVTRALHEIRAHKGFKELPAPADDLYEQRVLLLRVEEMVEELAGRIRVVRGEAYNPVPHD